MVAGLVAAMAAPTEKLSDYQTAGLKRVLKSVWDGKGQAMSVDDIAKALCAESDRRLTDVGEQLFPFRKYGGAAVTITQSVNDLYRSPTGRAIVENSANMYLLGQKAEAIEALKADKRLPLSDGGYSLLKTVHTVPGVYSEIFFITERGTGIGRLVVDPFKRILFSTRADDVNALKQLRRQGLGLQEAIHRLMADKKEETQRVR